MVPVKLFAQAFWCPKDGNSVDEYEDAFAPRRLAGGSTYVTDAPVFRCAVIGILPRCALPIELEQGPSKTPVPVAEARQHTTAAMVR
jgi:hypothetical protein